jgi:hypothetical protein
MCCSVSASSARLSSTTDLVKCEHLPDHLPAILKCHLHAVVDLRIVSSMRFRAKGGALTRFCYSIRRQSVSMRVFSQGQDSSCWTWLLTIFPCLFAAPDMLMVARPRTT